MALISPTASPASTPVVPPLAPFKNLPEAVHIATPILPKNSPLVEKTQLLPEPSQKPLFGSLDGLAVAHEVRGLHVSMGLCGDQESDCAEYGHAVRAASPFWD